MLAPVAAAAVSLPPATFVPASRANYAPAKRTASAVKLIVVHETEGTYRGTIAWFRNPHARASANYVVGRDGAITQMVRERDVAWHAGNGWVNRHSLGVEHEGYTGVAGTVTDVEYRASAQLVAALVRRSHVPIDRRHVIGHAEVPDPVHPWLRGGYSHHTDPGRFWDWTRYMAYVRSFARGVVPPPPVFDVTSTGASFGQTVAGAVRFEATPVGEPADHVDLRVNGRTQATVRAAPYVFAGGAWDTTLVRNGVYSLTAHAVAVDGRTADASVVVRVANPAVKVTDAGLENGQVVAGVVSWAPKVTGAPARVELVVDATVRATLTQRPYALDWDTTAEVDGPHTLIVRAFRSDGKLLASRKVGRDGRQRGSAVARAEAEHPLDVCVELAATGKDGERADRAGRVRRFREQDEIGARPHGLHRPERRHVAPEHAERVRDRDAPKAEAAQEPVGGRLEHGPTRTHVPVDPVPDHHAGDACGDRLAVRREVGPAEAAPHVQPLVRRDR